ncbi:MAG TPA: hypothetical protein P5119_09825 [Candidatus Aminicenantes bacterium]|nr:hypothetical protein [Candidatus Aminicenantes bacterium]HRY65621.1 hypothetical protein [Candidatus Aminicenantes bacterium]HRZ72491.1 hypothetical protein [Candidatus Aminicenantes bacterium]
MRSPLPLVIAVLAACAVAAAFAAPPDGETTVFRAQMLTGKAPVEPPLIKIQIEVKGWTSPEEIRAFQQAFEQGGTDGYLAAFDKADKGVVRFMYARGFNIPIHAAVTVPAENGKKVLLFMNRQQWDPGYQKTRGRYLFMAIELRLNEKGKGEGRFYDDAQVRLEPSLGLISVETYDSTPKIFPQVQEVVKKPAADKAK